MISAHLSASNVIFVGETFQFSLNYSETVKFTSFTLIYDPSVLEYRKGSVVTTLAKRNVEFTPGTITFDGFGGPGSSKVSFTFKSIKTTVGTTVSADHILANGEDVPSDRIRPAVLPAPIHSAEAQKLVDDTHQG